MLGNDLVDIKMARDDGWKNKRYLDKIFNESEQNWILNSENPNKTLWLIWSMKESAYKAHFRKMKKRELAPLKIHCTRFTEKGGGAIIEGQSYRTHSEMNKDCIHTIAVEGGQNLFKIQKAVVHDFESELLRNTLVTELLQSFSKSYNYNIQLLELRKSEKNIPYLYYDGKSLNHLCSLSHHGRYGAFVISEE